MADDLPPERSVSAESSIRPPKPHTFRCPGCSANLQFAPVNGALTCPYCGRIEKIPETPEEIREHSYEAYLTIDSARLVSSSEQFEVAKCTACGANLEISPEQTSGDCPFCSAPMVLIETSKDPLVAPEAVLPMLVNPEQGKYAVRRWLESRWFAPRGLKQYAEQESLQGIYLPYWTFDANTVSHYVGERGEHYYEQEYVTEYRDGKPQRVLRQVQKTRWYPAAGITSRWFDDVTVAATVSLKQQHVNALDPWDLSSLKPFDPAFLAGFKSERYRIDLPGGFERAKERMKRLILDDVAAEIGGDEQRITRLNTAYSAVTFKSVLLPVWAGAYRLNGKVYQVVVNGRTGYVQGDRPYSFWKIFFAVIAAILLLAFLSQALNESPRRTHSHIPARAGYDFDSRDR